ncbi:MAG: methyltransferase domain-containing protein [Thaumarchaeota archaeon]|nr:methyltransferase domain-containing protein [Nitrososphaerota archaeon]
MSDAGQYVRLVTTGRKTGKPHPVLVRYVMYGGRMVVFPQVGTGQDWVANLERNSSLTVTGGNSRWKGQARFVRVNSLKDPVLGAFTRKYGEVEVRKRYWGQSTYVEIELLDQEPEAYDELVYSDLEAAFDGVAETYDSHIFGNPMNLWLRNRSVSLLRSLFGGGDQVVEVGCGTGTETLSLARRGVKVLACDISSRMLDVMMKKARREGLEDSVVPLHCRPYEIRSVVKGLGIEKVDGAYSTYGAVNTEPRLGAMVDGLHRLIKNDGELVLGVWNRYCMYEILGYSLRLRPSMAFARFRNPVPVGKSRFCVASNAYSVADVSAALSGYFRLKSVYGVGILLPPSNLTRYLPPQGALRFVERADVAIQGHLPWNRLGDHFLGVYSRNA